MVKIRRSAIRGWRLAFASARGYSSFRATDRSRASSRTCGSRRLIGIKTEIIEHPPANRVRVWILPKGLGVPGNRAGGLGDSPRSVAITGIILCSIVCPSGMLRRRVKPNVSNINASCQWHAERSNRPIKILVVEGILIMPNPSHGMGHFVAEQPEPIVGRIGFDLVDR